MILFVQNEKYVCVYVYMPVCMYMYIWNVYPTLTAGISEGLDWERTFNF